MSNESDEMQREREIYKIMRYFAHHTTKQYDVGYDWFSEQICTFVRQMVAHSKTFRGGNAKRQIDDEFEHIVSCYLTDWKNYRTGFGSFATNMYVHLKSNEWARTQLLTFFQLIA